ncbi:MAG: hypothetical protein IPH62_15135 [Ignavibacteriae bacterium]|nr:hypothetical protein [Ignavibacteriota bacterium]
MANDNIKVGSAAIELGVIDKTKEGFEKIKSNSKKEVKSLEDSLKNVKVQLDTRIASMQFKELEKFHTYLKKRLEEKIKLNVDSRSIETTKTQIGAVADKLNKLRTEASLMQKSSANIGDLFSGAMGVKLSTAGIVAGVTALGTIAVDAAKAYIEIEGVQNAFNKLNNPNILDKLREVTRNTIADSELMQISLRAVDKNISFDNLETILELAKNKASETGMSFDYLAIKLIDDIGNKSTSALENFGVSVSEMEAEIKNVGNYGEAAFNMVSKSITNMGFVAETNKDKLEQIYSLIKNIKEAFGGFVFDAINFTVKYSSPQNIMNSEMQEAYEKVMKEFTAKQKQLNESIKSAQNTASENSIGKSENQILDYIKIVQEKINNFGEATTEEEKTKLEQLNAKLNVYKKAHEDLAPLLEPYKKSLGDIEEKIKTLQSLQKNYAISDSQYSNIGKEIDRLENIINPKKTKVKVPKEKKTKLDFSEFDLIGEDQAWMDELIKNENEAAKIRLENLQLYIDARNELSEDEKKDLKERLEREKEIHELRMNALGEFGNALEGLGSHGKTFVSYFNTILQTALRISDALNTMKEDPFSGGLGIASGIFGLVTKLIPGMAKGGSVSNFGGGNIQFQPHQKFASGVNNFVVPPGFNRDNYLVGVQSGERLNVTPANQTNNLSTKSIENILSGIYGRIGAMNLNVTNAIRGGLSDSQIINLKIGDETISKVIQRRTNRNNRSNTKPTTDL